MSPPVWVTRNYPNAWPYALHLRHRNFQDSSLGYRLEDLPTVAEILAVCHQKEWLSLHRWPK